MATAAIPVIRSTYLHIFMHVAHRCCDAPEECLRRANLPAAGEQDPDAYVPLQSALSFMAWAARGEDLDELMLRVTGRLQETDSDASLSRAVRSAATLEAALNSFVQLADREQSAARYRLECAGQKVRVIGSLDGITAAACRDVAEWLGIASLLTLIRCFAGATWAPREIFLMTRRDPGPGLRRAFPNTIIRTGQAESGVSLCVSALQLTPARNWPIAAATRIAAGGSAPDSPSMWDFPTSLGEILKSYMADGYPDVALAARIVGCSVRTLQRRLKDCNASYTDVVKVARFEVAEKLLAQGDCKIIDTAYSVGYSDPSHFARAFRSYAGISPHQYRSRLEVAHV